VKLAWAAFGIRGAHMNTQTIHRHMMTKHHLAAMMQITGGRGQSPIGSPPLADFLVVLHDSRQGLAHASNKTVGHRHKISRMRWCLAEAIKDIERSHIKHSIAVALHQDAREQLFLVRYAAVTKDMHVMRGVLGIARNFGTTSDDICKAIVDICKQFCTPRLSPPHVDKHNLMANNDLFEHLRLIVEVVDADAAADEQRAIRILQGTAKSMAITQRAFFPNLKVVLRDRTHAATRPSHVQPSRVIEIDRASVCPDV
jgi:hypothetical protein